MHFFIFNFITGMKLGLELLDEEVLESEGAWGIEFDLLILRVAYIYNRE